MEWEEIDNIYCANRFLKTVTIELVNQCNWNCKHCYLDKKFRILDKDKVFQIIDEAKELGAIEIKLTGGEITMHPNLSEIIEYARKNYLDVILLSNLYKMSGKVFESIKKYKVKRVEVTLFSIKDSVHDSFVGVNGALKQSMHNMNLLKQEGIEVLVKTWAIKSNIDELEEMQSSF